MVYFADKKTNDRSHSIVCRLTVNAQNMHRFVDTKTADNEEEQTL